MYFINNFSFLNLPSLSFLKKKTNHKNPAPRAGPQDLFVTHYDQGENEQKHLKLSNSMRI